MDRNCNLIDAKKFDWKSYYKDAEKTFSQMVYDNFDNWTNSKKRYSLIANIYVVEESPGAINKTFEMYDYKISSNTIESLLKIWNSQFMQESYNSTTQSFIVDNQKREVVQFLSISA